MAPRPSPTHPVGDPGTGVPWASAWQNALYGPHGFYRRPEGPAGHFRTAAHASSGGLLGRALADLAARAGCDAVVDVGAGRGELLVAVGAAAPGLRLLGVDVADRPPGLPERIGWAPEVPAGLERTLLVGWEVLDVVPCPVLEVGGDGVLREVLVDAAGRERPGPPAGADDVAWALRWWPVDGAPAGARVEVGAPRERWWAQVAARVRDGLVLAVDYGHDRQDRPVGGSLTGFRAGRQVRPVPDGSTDVTAHVALDALAAALQPDPPGPGPAARVTVRCTQHEALSRLGVAAVRPDPAWAVSDPLRYLRALQARGEAAELLDPGGLGGFGWVLHGIGDPAVTAVRGLVGPSAA